MAKCFCGNDGVVTSVRNYNLCLSHMRQLLCSYAKEDKTEFEEKLWEIFFPPSTPGWVDVEYVVERLINVFFFSGDELEYYIPDEYVDCDEYDTREEYLIDQEKKNKVPTRECIYCQEEKAFELLCDDCVGLYNTYFYWAIKHKDIIDSLVLSHFEENDLGREEAFKYLFYIEEKSLKKVGEGLQTSCNCGKNLEGDCECLPF